MERRGQVNAPSAEAVTFTGQNMVEALPGRPVEVEAPGDLVASEAPHRKEEGDLMKRIAIATEGEEGLSGNVSPHFGESNSYTIVKVEKNGIVEEFRITSPFFCQHRTCSLPNLVREQNADVIIAGSMGKRAMSIFKKYGIEVVTGASGNAKVALNDYLSGKLKGIVECKHHEEKTCHKQRR
jgi:predicted Fe-Mo cluster-binding NifX family protein